MLILTGGAGILSGAIAGAADGHTLGQRSGDSAATALAALAGAPPQYSLLG